MAHPLLWAAITSMPLSAVADQLSATHCVTANVLRTKVDGQYNLATELN